MNFALFVIFAAGNRLEHFHHANFVVLKEACELGHTTIFVKSEDPLHIHRTKIEVKQVFSRKLDATFLFVCDINSNVETVFLLANP